MGTSAGPGGGTVESAIPRGTVYPNVLASQMWSAIEAAMWNISLPGGVERPEWTQQQCANYIVNTIMEAEGNLDHTVLAQVSAAALLWLEKRQYHQGASKDVMKDPQWTAAW